MNSPSADKRILIIHNPTAGRGLESRLFSVEKILNDRNCHVTLLASPSPSHLTSYFHDGKAADWDVVAIAGGDGTLMRAINALAQDAPVLALIATGTANVVALDLGLMVEADALADIILSGRTRPFCAAKVNSRLFAFTAGVGFDAAVVDRVSPSVKKTAGKLAFVFAAISTLVAYRYPEYEIAADNMEFSGVGVIVVNGRYYAGKHVVAPDNDLGSGRLCAIILHKPGRIAALKYVLAMALDRLHTRADVTFLQNIRSVDIKGDAMTPVQVDGEILCHLPARIEAGAKRFEFLA